MRSNDWWVVAGAATLGVLVLIAQGGYVFVGSRVADTKSHEAGQAISKAISDLDGMGDSFDNIGSNFQWLTSYSFGADQLRPLADQFVQTWHVDAGTIATDDNALAGTRQKLNDQSWLTLPSRAHLDQEAGRVTHARKALAAAGTVAGDLEKDGQFLQKFADAVLDIANGDAAVKANNAQEYATSLSKLVADAGAAVPLAEGPGLPPEVHALVTALYTLARDTRSAAVELAAGTTTKAEATKILNADIAALSAVSTDRVPDEINAYFKPYVDQYHSEASAASH